MNLIVFGATGGTGRQVVAQALTAGHAVTAVARRPDALAIRHDRLAVLHGDVLEPATLAQPLAGQDAVVSALGVRSRAPTTVFSTVSDCHEQAPRARPVDRARRPGRLHHHTPRRAGLVPCAGRGRCGVAAADEQGVGLHDKEAYR
jgi:NAD(P)-dependent dehydrogenase (short-subunit alcohol dehydrogenase family)